MCSGAIVTHNALRNAGTLAGMIAKGICLCLLVVGCASRQAAVTDNGLQPPSVTPSTSAPESAFAYAPPLAPPPRGLPQAKRANFEREPKSKNAHRLADWVVDSGDNRDMPFLIVDKTDGKVFLFYADGRLRGAAPALVGLARGDDSVPGIGDRELSAIRPEERTTPAGRFIASLGRDYNGKEILWVDYGLALSLHRVVTTNPVERRLERLTSSTPNDNRISFGCINVPEKFYDKVVRPAFTETYGVVYILPDTRSNRDVFASYYEVDDIAEKPTLRTWPGDQGVTFLDLILSFDPGYEAGRLSSVEPASQGTGQERNLAW